MRKKKQQPVKVTQQTLKRIITRILEEKTTTPTLEESIGIQFRDARKVLGEQRDLRIRKSLEINEQDVEREIIFPDMPAPEVEVTGGFTGKDRRMVQAIFDTVVGGGANVGGYRGEEKEHYRD